MLHSENFQTPHSQIDFAIKTLEGFCWMVGYKVAKVLEQKASTFISKIIIAAVNNGATELYKLVIETSNEDNENTPINGQCSASDDSATI